MPDQQLTDEQLAELLELSEKATPGEWAAPHFLWGSYSDEDDEFASSRPASPSWKPNSSGRRRWTRLSAT